MKLFFFAFLFFFSSLNFAQVPPYQWAHGWGNKMIDFTSHVVTDMTGNSYVVGYFRDTVDFDPGVATVTIAANVQDVFISKFDPAGNFLWVKTIGGIGTEYSSGASIDASGNLVVSGYFANTVDFDPGPGTFTMTSSGAQDNYVMKLDANGNFKWAVVFGGTASDLSRAMTIDKARNIYVFGSFFGITDYDPGSSTYNLSSTQGTLFVLKLDSNGVFTWARNFGQLIGGGGASFLMTSIEVDAGQNVFMTGYYGGAAIIDFEPGPGTFTATTSSTSNTDIFVSKFDPLGNRVWTKFIGGTGQDIPYSVKVRGSVLYLSGTFEFSPDFDPGVGTYSMTSAGSTDIFYCSLDTAGTFILAEQIGSAGPETTQSMTIDNAGNVYLACNFYNTVDLDPTSGVSTLTSAGNLDAAVVKLTPVGAFVWAKGFGGTGNEFIRWINVHGTGSVHLGGYFTLNCNFDPGGSNYSLNELNGSGDAFVLKWGVGTSTSIQEETVNGSLKIYPNPFSNTIYIDLDEEAKFIIINSWGAVEIGGSIKPLGQAIDLSDLASGIYFLRVNERVQKIVKQ